MAHSNRYAEGIIIKNMPKTKAISNPIKEPAEHLTEISSVRTIKQNSAYRSKDMHLVYDGKIDEIELLNSIPKAYLKEIESFGQLSFHGSYIWSDPRQEMTEGVIKWDRSA